MSRQDLADKHSVCVCFCENNKLSARHRARITPPTERCLFERTSAKRTLFSVEVWSVGWKEKRVAGRLGLLEVRLIYQCVCSLWLLI